jgi:glycosyltransferase involved in cell wall biosynthesis
LRISDHTNSFLGKLLSINSQWINYEMEYCKNADKIIVVVEEAAHRLGKIGIDKRKILVVSNTLNTDSFKMPSATPDENYFTLFYAGGINRHRGLQYIIRGLKFVKTNRKIRVWLLGSGSYVEELKRIAIDENVSEKVEFFGWKNFEEMNEMMGKADVCLIPHQKSDHTDTTIPHKLFQYMFAGKVIVTSNCLPLARIVNETKSGLVYQWDDSKDFADKLTNLINRPEELQQMTENGRKRVAEKYLWNFDSDRLIEMYKSMKHG